MTREKLEELRQRMIHHAVVNDIAVCVLTARELQELIEAAEALLDLKQELKEEAEFPTGHVAESITS